MEWTDEERGKRRRRQDADGNSFPEGKKGRTICLHFNRRPRPPPPQSERAPALLRYILNLKQSLPPLPY